VIKVKEQIEIMQRYLKPPFALNAAAPQNNDEYFVNGVFYFNITNLKNEIASNTTNFICAETKVNIWRTERTAELNGEYVEAADLTRPLILAEIAPDRYLDSPDIEPDDWLRCGYNLIDGHHRIEKAYRANLSQLRAFIVPMEAHIHFMYNGFDKYTNYWNGKLKDYVSDLKSREGQGRENEL
jgi:hypothetical protein